MCLSVGTGLRGVGGVTKASFLGAATVLRLCIAERLHDDEWRETGEPALKISCRPSFNVESQDQTACGTESRVRMVLKTLLLSHTLGRALVLNGNSRYVSNMVRGWSQILFFRL